VLAAVGVGLVAAGVVLHLTAQPAPVGRSRRTTLALELRPAGAALSGAF
jgi:hypothetical protein